MRAQNKVAWLACNSQRKQPQACASVQEGAVQKSWKQACGMRAPSSALVLREPARSRVAPMLAGQGRGEKKLETRTRRAKRCIAQSLEKQLLAKSRHCEPSWKRHREQKLETRLRPANATVTPCARRVRVTWNSHRFWAGARVLNAWLACNSHRKQPQTCTSPATFPIERHGTVTDFS